MKGGIRRATRAAVALAITVVAAALGAAYPLAERGSAWEEQRRPRGPRLQCPLGTEVLPCLP